MVRVARRKSKSGIYHVMVRGINKQTIFEDTEDRLKFLKTLKKYKQLCKYELYSYCLMDNHVHLLLKETSTPISNIMLRIGASYVHWYNDKYDRYGHLFQGRFKSETVETPGSFIRVLRYIHQNPLKAGMVKNILEYRWSSIHEYIGKAKMVDVDFGLQLFSKERQKAKEEFLKYMEETSDDEFLDMEEKVKFTDEEVIRILKQMGIPSPSKLQQMMKKDRDAILAELNKLEGISIRQLSRVTGISKSVIHRAGR